MGPREKLNDYWVLCVVFPAFSESYKPAIHMVVRVSIFQMK